jgi:HEAT repeats
MIWLVGTALAGTAETKTELLAAPWPSGRAAIVADAGVSDADLLTLLEDPTAGLRAAIVLAWRQDPPGAATVQATAYRVGAGGAHLFTAPVPAGLAPVVIERLLYGGEPLSERIALAAWLKRSAGPFAGVALAAARVEAHEEVRGALVDVLRYDKGAGSRAAVVEGLRLGLQDPAATVRATAARAVGWTQASELATELVAATSDPNDEVAGAAARSLGWLAATAPSTTFPAVVGVLGRSDPRARLEALRALERLDPARAAALPEVQALTADADPKVARAAQALAPR